MLNAEKGQALNLDGAQLRIGIVQARFNESITNSLTQAAAKSCWPWA
jgi:6,7-dimethyl-8-ribityllumazine synthase